MATGGRIDYTVGFKVDTTQLNALKTQLGQLQTNVNQLYANNAGRSLIDPTKFNAEVNQINASIAQMQTAFNSAFNTQLGTLNISKFNQALESSKIPLSQIQADFYKLGSAGQNAFRSIAAQALSTNMQLKQSHTFLTSMADTLVNTMKWGVASSAINTVANSVRKAYDYTKQLDKSLNNISIVTEKSADDMRRFAKEANKAAKELGSTTTKYTDAALIYYQQGDSDAVAQAKAEVTLKTANVTKQSTDEVSEQLTAVWNGYKVSAQEAEIYVDKLAAVAASTASDLEELSTGMSKVASAAATMGVDVDQLNGMLATMISVTRESPETIGTSMKTILARISDIEAGLDGETSLTNYTEAMANLGFNVLDANGKLRDMGDVIEEIGGNWNTLTREQQVSLAHTMAGQRQYSRLLSLFDNWGMYEESLKTSQNSLGTLNEQNEIYMESMEAHLNKLTAASEKLYDELMDPEGINPLIDSLTVIVDLLGSFTSVIGGGAGALQLLGLIGMKVFQKQIVSGLTTTITNMQTAKHNATLLKSEMQALENLEKSNNGQDKRLTNIINMKKDILKYSEAISNEDRETLNQMIQQTEELYKQQDALKERSSKGSEFLNRRTGKSYQFVNEDGSANQGDFDRAKKDLGVAESQIKAQTASHNEFIEVLKKEEQAYLSSSTTEKGLVAAKDESIAKTEEYIAQLKASASAEHLDEEFKRNSIPLMQTLGDQIKVYNQLRAEEKAIEAEITSVKKQLAQVEKESAAGIELQARYEELLIKQTEIKAKVQNQYASTQVNINKLREESTASIRREQQALDENKKSIRTLDAELNNNKQALENGQSAFENFKNSIQIKNVINGFVNGLNAVSQFAMGLNSLANAWDAIRNPDMSGWEKFSQITMGLSMGFGMLVSSISSFSSMISAVFTFAKTSLDNYNTSILTSLTYHKLDRQGRERYSQLLTEEATKRGINKNSIDAETRSRLRAQVAEEQGLIGKKAYVKTLAEETWRHIANKLGIVLETDSLKINTSATWANIKAKMVQNWWILAVAAAVGVLVVGLKKANEAYNKDQIAADKAAAAAQNASSAFEEAQSKYDTFKDNISKYGEAVDGLAQLTEGTIEYKEQVIEANQAAMDLITSLGLLSDSYTIDPESGLIEINKDVWKEIQLQQLENLEKAYAYSAYTNQKNTEAQAKAARTSYARESLEGKDTVWSMTDRDKSAAKTQGAMFGAGALGGLATSGISAATVAALTAKGATVGTAIGPGIGTLVGAIVGLAAGGITTLIQTQTRKEATKEEEDALHELAKIAKDRPDGAITEQDVENLINKGYSQDLIDSLNKDIDITRKHIEAINANTEALKTTYTQMAQSILSSNEWYKGLSDREKGLTNSLVGVAAAEATDKKSKEYQEAREKAKEKFAGPDSKSTYEDYLIRRFGEEEAKNYRVTNMGGKAATLQKQNDEGTWDNVGEKDSLLDEEVIDFLTEQYLIESLGKKKSTQKNLDRLNEVENVFDSIKGVDKDEILGVQEALAKGEDVDLTVLSPEQVENLKTKVESQGKEIGKTYKNALDEAIKDYETDGYGETQYLAQQEQQYQSALEDTSTALEMEKDTLELYTDAIINNNSELQDNKKAAVEVAKQNISFAKGTEKLQEALEDNLDILKTWNEDAMETYEAAAQVQSALEEMFGVKVSADFIRANLEKIRKAAEGDITAIEELQTLAAKDFVLGLEVSDEYKTKLDSLIDEIAQAGADIEIGGELKLDNSEGIKALNDLAIQGAITEEEIKKLFSSMGYTPEIDYVEAEKPQESRTIQTVTRLDGEGNPTEDSYTDEIVSKTYVQVPQIVPDGENAPKKGGGKSGSAFKTSSARSRSKAIGSLGDKKVKSGTEKNKKDLLDEERDIYHDINIELQKLENNLEKVQKAREKLVGGDIIDSLDKELGLLDKQIAAQKTKLEIAKLESQTLKETLSGQGVQFAEDGTITNYNAILDAKEAEINGLINAYNNASSTEAQESIQEQIDAKQEAYDQFKENLERYDEVTFSELAELENEVSEAISQKIELNIEKFTKDINLKVDLVEFKKEWRELQKSILFGDNNNFAIFQSAAEGLQDIFGADGSGLLADQMERAKVFLGEYDTIVNGGTSSIFEDSAAAALEAAQEMHEMSMESAQQALEYINTLKEAVDAAFEQIMGLHDSILDTFDHTLAVIEHQIAVKELLFGSNANIEDETEAKLDVQLQKIEAAKNKMEDARKRAEDILNGRTMEELEADEEDFYKWTEQQVDISEAYETIFSSVEEALQTINTLLQQDIQNNLDIVEDKLTNNVGWDRLSERWEKDQELADVYLSGINKEYELQKLLNKINQDLLDKQYDSINAQKKINDFKNDELAILMQKDKLTQAELDRANKLYELTLLQIALDEARNNKSSMKLTRDSQGNYVYQYTTDEDAVAKAEQDLADKRNELYNQNVDNTTKAISDFNSLGQEMQDEIAGIFEDDKFQEYLGLSTLENRTEEEQKRFEELDKWLYGTIDEITSDYNYRMGAARDNAIASLGYIFKDLGIENVDLNNLTDEQRQILLDEGINMQRLGTLLGFDENTLSKTLTDLDANIQSMIDTYVGRVDLVTDAAAGVESPEEYYETLDLIKLNTENLRDRFKSQQEKVWKEYSDMDNTLKSDISLIEENLKSLVKEGGLLATNNKNITDKLQSNADSVAKKIDEAILAIGKVETAVTGLVTDINSLKQQIKDNSSEDPDKVDNTEKTNRTPNPNKETENSGNSSYSPKFGDRVQYGSNTGSKSWKVQSVHQYDGRVDLINQLTGKSKTVHMSELTGKYNNETWEDVSKYKGLRFHYDKDGNGVINHKTESYNGSLYWEVSALTSKGKFILKPSLSSMDKQWADTSTEKKKYLNVLTKKKLSEYDTGGYTGSWFNGSKDGRLAMLHQKELILNEKDTPRILDAVKLVREISAGSIIKDFEEQMRNTLSSLENQLIGTYANIEGMAAAAKQSTDQMLEQAVHIDASFPGVKDAREIEEALNNLVNVASQYAYENNK